MPAPAALGSGSWDSFAVWILCLLANLRPLPCPAACRYGSRRALVREGYPRLSSEAIIADSHDVTARRPMSGDKLVPAAFLEPIKISNSTFGSRQAQNVQRPSLPGILQIAKRNVRFTQERLKIGIARDLFAGESDKGSLLDSATPVARGRHETPRPERTTWWPPSRRRSDECFWRCTPGNPPPRSDPNRVDASRRWGCR